MEKIIVKKEQCIGCGICASENPDYFNFDDNGLSNVIKENVEEEDKSRILESVERCPVEAIIIENEKIAY